MKQHVADSMKPGDHGSTFAGNPLVTRAAETVVDIISGEHEHIAPPAPYSCLQCFLHGSVAMIRAMFHRFRYPLLQIMCLCLKPSWHCQLSASRSWHELRAG